MRPASLPFDRERAQSAIRQAQEAGLEWPLAEDSTDEALAQRFYPRHASPQAA
jgi:hypothetical protein